MKSPGELVHEALDRAQVAVNALGQVNDELTRLDIAQRDLNESLDKLASFMKGLAIFLILFSVGCFGLAIWLFNKIFGA